MMHVCIVMHLAEVILPSCWGREGRSFRTLLGCFGEQRGSWLVWLVFPCLESMPGSIYGRTNMEKSLADYSIHKTHELIYIQTCSAAVSCSKITTVFWSFYSVWPVAMVASREKKQTLKADSVWQLGVSFHRALWCCVVLWLVCVTNQILVASLLLPAQWVCLPVQQSGPEFTASREKQTSLSLKSSWKTPSICFFSTVSSLVLNGTKN